MIESKVASPIVPLALFRSGAFAGTNLLTLFLYAAFAIFFFVLPLNLIQVQGYSATAAGGAILPLIFINFVLSRWSGGLVQRYGARGPLIIGTSITMFGFLLVSLPGVGGSYWTTFFPGLVVTGLGMAVSVAPLTTVVMDAVDSDHVGTASGINNAVARVAGVLAVAVLGAVMIADFGMHLDRSLTDSAVPSTVRASLESQRNRLAALKPQPQLNPGAAEAIESSIQTSFVASFRLIMWICAALTLAAAFVAVDVDSR